VAEMPSIEDMYGNYKDNPNVIFALISFDKDPKKAEKFVDKKGYTLPIYFPNATQIPKVYESRGIPTTFVIDKSGFIAYKKIGMANYDSKSFAKMMDGLIAE